MLREFEPACSGAAELETAFGPYLPMALRMKAATERMELYCAAHPNTPSAIYRPELVQRGGVWIALLGPSISEGVAGFGYSVEAALSAFDRQHLASSRSR